MSHSAASSQSTEQKSSAANADTTSELRDRLRSVLIDHTDDPGVAVADLRRIPAGASRQTWSATMTGSGGSSRRIVLRMELPGAYADSSLTREAALMNAAGAVGVPSPTILGSGEGNAVEGLAGPYVVMDHIEGESVARPILREDAYASARATMAAQSGDILARIHSIPTAALPHLPDNDELEEWGGQLARWPRPYPTFELALRWLRRNRPEPSGHGLVHGDFRLGNLIIGPEGIRAVLDWELAHLGDPLEDLGWMCVKAWRFGGSLPVGGFGELDDFVGAYEDRSGIRVDRDALHWWQVLGTLKWGLICVYQSQRHLGGTTRSVELAAIGRRVSENESELLDLLCKR